MYTTKSSSLSPYALQFDKNILKWFNYSISTLCARMWYTGFSECFESLITISWKNVLKGYCVLFMDYEYVGNTFNLQQCHNNKLNEWREKVFLTVFFLWIWRTHLCNWITWHNLIKIYINPKSYDWLTYIIPLTLQLLMWAYEINLYVLYGLCW